MRKWDCERVGGINDPGADRGWKRKVVYGAALLSIMVGTAQADASTRMHKLEKRVHNQRVDLNNLYRDVLVLINELDDAKVAVAEAQDEAARAQAEAQYAQDTLSCFGGIPVSVVFTLPGTTNPVLTVAGAEDFSLYVATINRDCLTGGRSARLRASQG